MSGVGAYKTPFPGGACKTPLQTPLLNHSPMQ